ncbi:MAG TPA: hypothetical protein VFG79_07480, partial [Solirubrobacter sp.]|nr:hypothetical protein [Solirubrobacter sp.]
MARLLPTGLQRATAKPSATSYCQPVCNEPASSSPRTAKSRATSRSFHCHGACTVTKLAQLGGARQIIEGSAGTISLPVLQSVGGELALRNSEVTALDCPQLRRTGGLTLVQSALHDLSGFPVLTEIAGDVQIASSPGLVSATLPSTSPVKIAGNLQLGGTANLERADWTVEDRLGNVNAGGLASFTLAVVPVHQPRSALGDVRMAAVSSIRVSAS